jgi:hypothetical protein
MTRRRAISVGAPRTADLEGIMTSSLATRTAIITGLESAALALGTAPEPTTRSLQYRLDYCQRARKIVEVPGLTALIATLESIAVSCFT